MKILFERVKTSTLSDKASGGPDLWLRANPADISLRTTLIELVTPAPDRGSRLLHSYPRIGFSEGEYALRGGPGGTIRTGVKMELRALTSAKGVTSLSRTIRAEHPDLDVESNEVHVVRQRMTSMPLDLLTMTRNSDEAIALCLSVCKRAFIFILFFVKFRIIVEVNPQISRLSCVPGNAKNQRQKVGTVWPSQAFGRPHAILRSYHIRGKTSPNYKKET